MMENVSIPYRVHVIGAILKEVAQIAFVSIPYRVHVIVGNVVANRVYSWLGSVSIPYRVHVMKKLPKGNKLSSGRKINPVSIPYRVHVILRIVKIPPEKP